MVSRFATSSSSSSSSSSPDPEDGGAWPRGCVGSEPTTCIKEPAVARSTVPTYSSAPRRRCDGGDRVASPVPGSVVEAAVGKTRGRFATWLHRSSVVSALRGMAFRTALAGGRRHSRCSRIHRWQGPSHGAFGSPKWHFSLRCRLTTVGAHRPTDRQGSHARYVRCGWWEARIVWG